MAHLVGDEGDGPLGTVVTIVIGRDRRVARHGAWTVPRAVGLEAAAQKRIVFLGLEEDHPVVEPVRIRVEEIQRIGCLARPHVGAEVMLEKVGATLPLGFIRERNPADVDRPGEDEVGDEEPLRLDFEVLLRGRRRKGIAPKRIEEGLVIRGIEFLIVVFEGDDEDVGLPIDFGWERTAPAVAELAGRGLESD